MDIAFHIPVWLLWVIGLTPIWGPLLALAWIGAMFIRGIGTSYRR